MVYDGVTGKDITCGFLIVVKFEVLYERHAPRYQLDHSLYALPRIDQGPAEATIRYRGPDREAIQAFGGSTPVFKYLENLEGAGDSVDGVILGAENVGEALRLMESEAVNYETIWVREVGSSAAPHPGFEPVGYEANQLIGDQTSPSCDCMMFPRWHGTDEEGVVFESHFSRLNRQGLFASPREAEAFRDYYNSFDWTEQEDYPLVEVYLSRGDMS